MDTPFARAKRGAPLRRSRVVVSAPATSQILRGGER